jgi:5-methylcytosine-specific restriction protein A
MALRMQRPLVRTADTSIARLAPKQTERHYGTAQHKAWAAEVIRRAGGRCQDPDHEETGKPYRVVADHVREVKDAPHLALDPRNGLARCWPCHTRKTNRERARRQAALPGGGGSRISGE